VEERGEEDDPASQAARIDARVKRKTVARRYVCSRLKRNLAYRCRSARRVAQESLFRRVPARGLSGESR